MSLTFKRKGIKKKSIKKNKKLKQNKVCTGTGFINSLISKNKTNLLLPGYNFCGLNGVDDNFSKDPTNRLDAECKKHDLAYNETTDLNKRHEADLRLADQAWQLVKAKDTKFSERLAAYLVTNLMKAKVKIGAGSKNKIKSYKSFKSIISDVRKAIKNSGSKNVDRLSEIAIQAAKHSFKGSKNKIKTPRIIPVQGGFLPFLLPILAGISAISGVATSAATIARTVNAVKNAKKNLAESKRHNQVMEGTVPVGNGLWLKKYKTGFALCFEKKKNVK